MLIKDRILLGIISGIAGNTTKILVDEVSMRLKISQRSFRSTAAGVWVNKNKEAEKPLGHLLGALFDLTMGAVGGVGAVYIISKTGRDQFITKGALYGITMGSILTAILSGMPVNKVRPKDAASNLSYMLSHLVYGITTTAVASSLGHPSLFDTEPITNYLKPTEKTTAELNQKPASRYTREESHEKSEKNIQH